MGSLCYRLVLGIDQDRLDPGGTALDSQNSLPVKYLFFDLVGLHSILLSVIIACISDYFQIKHKKTAEELSSSAVWNVLHLHYSPILDNCILVDDNDAVMDGVQGEISFLSRNIVYADSASITDACILVDDRLADDGASSDADVGYSLLGIGSFLGFGLIVGRTHAVYTVQGGS